MNLVKSLELLQEIEKDAMTIKNIFQNSEIKKMANYQISLVKLIRQKDLALMRHHFIKDENVSEFHELCESVLSLTENLK